MNKLVISFLLLILSNIAFSQDELKIDGKVVFSNDDVVFHQIDEHTWVGSGNETWHESLYLVEGDDKAVLIDAGTSIKDLKNLVSAFMGNYQGVIKYFEDGEIIDLGNRQLEVVYTPGHTLGATTFIDKKAGYGFSGDSFGTGLLLLTVNFSTFIASCEKIIGIMKTNNIKCLYPGHYNYNNVEMLFKIEEMLALSKNVLSGNIKASPNSDNTFGLKLLVEGNGYNIIFNDSALK